MMITKTTSTSSTSTGTVVSRTQLISSSVASSTTVLNSPIMHPHIADATTIIDDVCIHPNNDEAVVKSSTQNPLQTPRSSQFELSQSDNISDEYCVFLDPWHRDNIGIFSSYLAVGFSMYFILTPLNFYMIDVLDATPGEQSIIIGLTNLPWALKMFCGFITDSYPINGLRRKPYLLGGWLLYCLCNIILAAVVTPNLAVLALFIFLQTWAFIQADVCTDAMIVERSKKYENDQNRGTLQATGYITRFVGAIFGASLGAVLYNKDDWGWGFPIWVIFLINGFFPLLCLAPFMRDLVEVKSETPPEISVQIKDMWAMVQRRAVWLPCSYIFLYNCLYLTNPAWNSFLVEGLNFSNFDIGVLAIAGTVLSYIGIVIYKQYLFESSWRLIYVGTTVVSAIFSGLQLILVFQLNKKIGMGARGFELLFAMGSYGMVQFVQAVQFLPACRMFIVMCPVGAEGASYAMLTTLSNLSQSVAYSVAAGCAEIWNVSNSKLEDQEWEGLWKLTLLCACCQIVPLAFIHILPANNEEQLALQREDVKSPEKGMIFVVVVTASLLFVVVYSIVVTS